MNLKYLENHTKIGPRNDGSGHILSLLMKTGLMMTMESIATKVKLAHYCFFQEPLIILQLDDVNCLIPLEFYFLYLIRNVHTSNIH